uniref:Tumor protein p53-inducible protein 13 n=1 Tax=Stegastes partitus TaxID=144197 RepID=A0A3B5APG4_9TELE
MVSWGRTLQLSTVASTDVCDWLETTQTTREESDAVSTSRRYNLLLTWSAGRRLQEQSRKMKVRLVIDSKERTTDDNPAAGRTDNDEVVEVKEREVEHSATHSHAGSDSAARSPSESQPAGDGQRRSSDCGGCRAGERCDCDPASGPEAPAAVVNNGLPRTPRTDEAVWAAAALGFLLVLLTLSVLHTRLYRHWRTTPSLYWHDPRQDYDSVADVIRRRLRIAKRRRKRGRRQECVLLPNEHPRGEQG